LKKENLPRLSSAENVVCGILKLGMKKNARITQGETMTSEELAQWLKHELEGNVKNIGGDRWLLTARLLQEKIERHNEVLADRLYEINRRISLNCIARKESIRPSQARLLNLALADIIKDLRKLHFSMLKHNDEASVATEDESREEGVPTLLGSHNSASVATKNTKKVKR